MNKDNVGWGLSLRDIPITRRYVGRIEKRSINNLPCHPELVSESIHRQKCSTICTQKINVGLKAQLTFSLAERKSKQKESTISRET